MPAASLAWIGVRGARSACGGDYSTQRPRRKAVNAPAANNATRAMADGLRTVFLAGVPLTYATAAVISGRLGVPYV